MAKIIVNGEAHDVRLPITVEQLIKENNVQQPEMVSVQVNDEFIERQNFSSHQIEEGDEIEFLYFMGGGQQHV